MSETRRPRGAGRGGCRFGVLFAAAIALSAAACSAGKAGGPTQTADNRPDGVASALRAASAVFGIGGKDGPSAAGSYLAGRHAQHVREPGDAADFLILALESDPANQALVERTVVLLMIEGRLDEALPYARKLQETGADTHMATLLLAVEDLRNGDEDSAGRRIASLPPSAFGTLLEPLLAAWTRVGGGSLESALQALAPLKANNGYSQLHALHAAMIADAMGRPEAALESYRTAIDEPGASTLRAVQAYGSFLERTGKADAAATLYEEFRDSREGRSMLPQVLLKTGGPYSGRPLVRDAREGAAEAMLTIAGAVQQHDLRDVSLILARLALRLRQDLDFARLLVAEVLEDEGRDEAALAMLRTLPDDTPFHWTAEISKARLLYMLDRSDEAFELLRALADSRPEDAASLIELGDLLRMSERWEEAAAVYERAMERSDGPSWTLYYHRGIVLERAGRWQQAEESFLKALDIKPDAALALNYLGYSWADQGKNLDRALEMIEQAVALRPHDGYIADSLGWVLYRVGDYERAVKELERAVEIRPEDPVINDHLGDAYWRVGREIEARFQWSRALALDPEASLVESIEAKLSKGLDAGPAQTVGSSQ